MIELRENDFVARSPLPAECARQVERERSHVLTEHDLVGATIEEIGKRLARVGDQRVCLFTRRIAPVRVGVVVEEVVLHRMHDAARNLRAAWAVEICDGKSIVRSLERRELRANVFNGRDVRGRGIDHRRHAITTPAHCSTSFTIST